LHYVKFKLLLTFKRVIRQAQFWGAHRMWP
jgi:hypothetical protein